MTTRFRLPVVFLLLTVGVARVQAATALRIGKASPVAILTPADPIGSERLASRELATYLEKMTGSKCRTAVLEGKPNGPAILVCRADRSPAWVPKADLADQEFRIKTDGAIPYLMGGGHKGVLYAVYAFLEDVCGVHWFIPGPHGECVPRKPTIEVPALDRRERPAFSYRALMDHHFQDKRAVLWWLIRNRMTPDRGRSRRHPKTREFYDEMAACGLKPSDVGFNRVCGHIFNRTIPVNKYFKTHPEWFPYFNGRNYPGGRNSRQPTLHAPGLIPLIVDVIRKGFDADPDLQVYSLCPNDGFNGWGNHPADTKWDGGDFWGPMPIVTDRLVHFCMEVAREIAASHPDKSVYTYAYTMRYKQPPKRFTDLPPNLDVDLVQQYNSHADHLRSLTDPRSKANANFRPFVAGWRKAVKGRIVYRTHWCLAMSGLIYPTWHTIQDTYKYLVEHRIDGVEHGCHRSYGHNGLSIWLTMKLSWNPDQDVAALKRTYCRMFFGEKAGLHMEAYFDRLRRAALESGVEASPGGMKIRGVRIFPESVQKDLDALLKKAEASADSAEVKWRVGLVRLGYRVHTKYLERQRRGAVGGIDYVLDRDRRTVSRRRTDAAQLADVLAFSESLEEQPQAAYVPEFMAGRTRQRLKEKAAKSPKPVPCVILRNQQIEALVAPSISGRLFQLTDLKSGVNVFRGFGGNYADSLGPTFGWMMWGFRDKFETVIQTDTVFIVKARTDNGLELTRRYELKGNRLRISLDAKNASQEEQPFHFLVRPLMMLGGRLGGDTAYIRQNGAWSRLDFNDNIYSSQWLCKRDKPDGKWAVTDGGSRVALINEFDPEAVDYCLLWDGFTSGMTLELISPLVRLQPGETRTFTHAYEILSDCGNMFEGARPFERRDTTW